MVEKKNSQWMISPKRFVKLLGAEFDIMQRAGTGVLARFYIAALAIVIIFILSLAGIGYAITLLFHDLSAEILLSCFFSLLFVCIYIFLLNTFSKEQLPGTNSFFSGSNIIRTCFLVFIAYLIAQPLAIFANSERLEQQTNEYKQTVLSNHLRAIDSFYANDLQKLRDRKLYCVLQNNTFSTHDFDTEIAGIDEAVSAIDTKVNRMGDEAARKINSSSFFLYRIKKGNQFVQSWVLTILFVLLFLLPGYLIFSISSGNEYYQLKKSYEKDIVEKAYLAFTVRYKQLFRVAYGLQIGIFSRYEDPPFKRVRKVAALPGSMDDFLKKYITAAD